MSTRTLGVLDAVCRYFGGPFDAATSDYRTPQVPGLGIVQRSLIKPGEREFRVLSLAGDAGTGSLLVVHAQRWNQNRESGPVGRGLLLRRYALALHLYTRTPALDPVVSWDACYQLADAVAEHIMADPTAGTGGWKDDGSGLWLGEGQGQSPSLSADFSQPSAAKTYTQQSVILSTVATQYLPG